MRRTRGGQGNYAMALRFDESYVEVAVAITGADFPAEGGARE